MSSVDTLTLVYVLGPGHCGSTLLNLLLNGHSNIIGLSEVQQLGLHDNPLKKTTDEQFWQKTLSCYDQELGESGSTKLDIDVPYKSYKKLLRVRENEVRRWVNKNEKLLECVSKISSCDIIVDTSKRWQRLYLLHKFSDLNIKVVHLVRDGRAVTYSYYKKYNDLRGIKRWVKSSIYAAYLQTSFCDSHWLKTKYELMATKTEQVLYNLCSFLGVTYERKMLQYREARNVTVGGNRMRHRSDNDITLDDSWKQELKWKHEMFFNLAAGWINRLHGYRFQSSRSEV
ncbi:sulfotransferase [Salinibacter ruber]|uniref:sulfotransferase n=1 Tax=Salinibacter ruber TaxID=146919 RepID=UPI0016136F2B|nr:sulfotransferase [Salinibacter ruber]MBB4091153.1 hypothetical protein [Salinibacter ruber]